MKVDGIKWAGICTAEFERTVAFFRDTMGLKLQSEGIPVVQKEFSRYAQFELADGALFEIIDGAAAVRALYNAPLVCFRVDNVAAARAEMESKGVEFIGPIHLAESYGWTYFRSPDGHLYAVDGAVPKATW
jgi:catechol 2,3-dioxygenase-like lactoylglutathione lyase family enzyme